MGHRFFGVHTYSIHTDAEIPGALWRLLCAMHMRALVTLQTSLHFYATSSLFSFFLRLLLLVHVHPFARTKAIGVSNFQTVHLEALAKTNTIKPMVNQCEMTVGSFDTDTAQYCSEHNITYQAYSVLHGSGISSSKTITSIANAHGTNVSNQQVVLRWVTQKGIPIVTASNVSAYDLEDMAIFTFNLTETEMKELDDYTPPSQCVANKRCRAIESEGCIMSGCKECDQNGDGDASGSGGTIAERAAVGFQADVVGASTRLGGKCNSCGCTKCCGKCVLKTSGKVTYCANK